MTYFVSEEAFNASNKHPHLYIGGKNVVHILFSFFLLLVFVFQLQSCQLHWGTSSQFPIRLNFSNKVSLFRRKIVWFCGNSTFIAFSGICFFFAFNWFRFFFLCKVFQVLACYFLHFFPFVGRSLVESYTFSFHQAGRSSSYNPTSTFPWLSNFSSVEVYRIFLFRWWVLFFKGDRFIAATLV